MSPFTQIFPYLLTSSLFCPESFKRNQDWATARRLFLNPTAPKLWNPFFVVLYCDFRSLAFLGLLGFLILPSYVQPSFQTESLARRSNPPSPDKRKSFHFEHPQPAGKEFASSRWGSALQKHTGDALQIIWGWALQGHTGGIL